MNRNQRRGAMGAQGGIFLSKSGTESIISLDTPMEEHVLISKTLQHPFRAPPQIPVDLKFAASTSATPPRPVSGASDSGTPSRHSHLNPRASTPPCWTECPHQ